jgi:hypothetical protein
MASPAKITRPSFGQPPVKTDGKPIAPSRQTRAPKPAAAAPSQEAIARLAYQYWEARGCPGGSPEEDWLRAENDLKQASGL